MTELIEALRSYTYWFGGGSTVSRDIHPPICDKAADTLEAQAKEIEELKSHSEAIRADYLALVKESLERTKTLARLEAEIEGLREALQNWHEDYHDSPLSEVPKGE